MYPLTIISDRYSGAYSGASFLAVNELYYKLPKEAGGSDTEAMAFWEHVDKNSGTKNLTNGFDEILFVGKGGSAVEALINLKKQIYDYEMTVVQ